MIALRVRCNKDVRVYAPLAEGSADAVNVRSEARRRNDRVETHPSPAITNFFLQERSNDDEKRDS